MSVNKAILVGYVGNNPELKRFDNGGAITSFSLATSERGYKLQNGTDVPERTDWHNISVRGKLAEVIEKYVFKGSHLYVEGKIRTRSYEVNNEKRYITEIHADTIDFLSKKEEGQGANNSTANTQQQTQAQRQPKGMYEHMEEQKQQATHYDDLPF